MIRKIFSLILIISIGIVGFLGFATMTHGHHEGCVVSIVQNVPCPQSLSTMAVHHIGAYTSFFSVLLVLPYLFGILLVCLWVLQRIRHTRYKAYTYFSATNSKTRLQVRIIRWLSLLENSPSYV